MNFTTFIKAYKIILAEIEKKVRDWNRVYLTDVLLDDLPTLTLVFSNSSTMEAGAIAMRTAINVSLVEQLKLGLDSLPLYSEYAKIVEEINDVGKFIAVLDFVLSQVTKMVDDITKDVNVTRVYFDLENNLAVFDLLLSKDDEQYSITIHTNGNLAMFSDYSLRNN